MLAIRLRRAGSKGSPFFRIVVTERREARDGRFVEIIGNYNPRTVPESLVVDRDRLTHWISVGAKPSDTVRTLVNRMPPPGTEPVAEAPAAAQPATAPVKPAAAASAETVVMPAPPEPPAATEPTDSTGDAAGEATDPEEPAS